MDNPEPRAQYLNVVLRHIERTTLRIPRFQRHFVWGEKDVVDLLESIEKGYPIGSILTWKLDQTGNYFSGFRTDPFPVADEVVSSYEVILDGAQRLSSLYGCLRNPGANPVYRVSYDLERAAFVHRAPGNGDPVQVPMDALFDSRKFLDVQAVLSELPEGEELHGRALHLYSTFQDYQIPIIALPNAELEDVVEVFRRVNSTGTALSAVDFVRALTWRSSFDLEETFSELSDRYQATSLEGIGEELLVKCLSVVCGVSLDARDVIRLKRIADQKGSLEGEVGQMRTALDRLAVLAERFGVSGVTEIPYEVQRLVLFALMHFEVSVDLSRLESWFWGSTFSEQHQSKPESYTSRLVRAIRDGDVGPALAVDSEVDVALLAERQRRRGTAVTVGFDLLLRRVGARSLLSGEEVGVASQHALLFTRDQLARGQARNKGSAQVLANVVPLTDSDASKWRELQTDRGLSLEELFMYCNDRTGEAQDIWISQGIYDPFVTSPDELLLRRSRALLEQVVNVGAG